MYKYLFKRQLNLVFLITYLLHGVNYSMDHENTHDDKCIKVLFVEESGSDKNSVINESFLEIEEELKTSSTSITKDCYKNKKIDEVIKNKVKNYDIFIFICSKTTSKNYLDNFSKKIDTNKYKKKTFIFFIFDSDYGEIHDKGGDNEFLFIKIKEGENFKKTCKDKFREVLEETKKSIENNSDSNFNCFACCLMLCCLLCGSQK